MIGSAGGTVNDVSGVSVVFPAGALPGDTTVRVAMDSTGAPPLPQSLAAAGSTFVVTPHGGNFAQPVEVAIPAPTVTLQPNQVLKLAKAQPGGQWEVLEDTTLVDGKLRARVDSFSYFTGVVLTYFLPLAQFEPLGFTVTLNCGDQPCDRAIGPVTATYTVIANNGQTPEGCTRTAEDVVVYDNGSLNYSRDVFTAIPRGATSVVKRDVTPQVYGIYYFRVSLHCVEYTWNTATTWLRTVQWQGAPSFPNLSVVRAPTQLDVIDGLRADLDVVIAGGASRTPDPFQPITSHIGPSATDRAIVDWQRSDDGGKSWRDIARSFQNEGNPLPFGTGPEWRPWSARHGFIALLTDQGALIRAHACYTPPAPTAPPPCVTGPVTRINVLQQSSLPVIVTGPRSMLVRTLEQANFSASATGLPAPTLQWQRHPANSTGEWTNVADGLGATTANYTTQPLMLDDNGTQYRVVATNSLGSAASAPVTVSVSDDVVAPSITTQPANLSVVSGGDAIFAIDAYGTEALSYQWHFNGNDIAGANSPVLRLSAVSGANVGSYTVSVSNSAGEEISNAASLTVTNGAPPVTVPSIVTQPAHLSVNVGSTAAFAVGVSGTGPFGFQWRRDGANITGATSAVLTLSSVALPNAGAYSVVVSNSAGAIVSSNAVLDVTTSGAPTPPSITTQPASLILPVGGSGIMAVGATGSGPLTYQWYQDGVAIPFATQPVLHFVEVVPSFAASYTVTVTNSVSSRTSQPATMILLGVPVITQQPAAVTTYQDLTATFSVVADGSALQYQWTRNGAQIGGATQATYTTPTQVVDGSGAVYRVSVYNAAGLVTSEAAILTVLDEAPPSVLQQPADRTVNADQTASICAAFGGSGPFDILLQRWSGFDWTLVLDEIVFADNTEFCSATPALQAGDNGAIFRLVASNGAGAIATDGATITVNSPPSGIDNTMLVSRSMSGGPANNISGMPSMSANGRLVAFVSLGTDLAFDAPNISGANDNAYVRDLTTNDVKLINYSVDGEASSLGVNNVKLSANGRYAIFTSRASDLVEDDTNNSMDVFRRDLLTGTNERLSLLPNGDELPNGVGGNGDYQLDISANGNVVTFICGYAIDDNGADNGNYFLYYRHVPTGATRLVAGSLAYGVAYSALSGNGEWIAYAYGVPAPANQIIETYDIEAHSHGQLISFDQSAGPVGLRQGISISNNGRYVAFSMVSQDVLGTSQSQVLVVDSNAPGEFKVASNVLGVPGNGASAYPKISGDGRYVLYSTLAPNLTNNLASAFNAYLVVSDVMEGNTMIASRRPSGSGASTGSNLSGSHAISEDGALVSFVADYNHISDGEFGDQVWAAGRPQ